MAILIYYLNKGITIFIYKSNLANNYIINSYSY